MATFGYLRVSTFEQNTEKNKDDILRFANNKQLGNVEFIEETISGTKSLNERLLGKLLETIKEGDILIVPELSRIARSISSILNVIKQAKEKGFILYSLKENFTTSDESITALITSTIFGLVAQIERDLISQRTKEALVAKKQQGITLGRPRGKGKSKLDGFKLEIESMIQAGVPKTKIANKYGITRMSLDNWLKRVAV